MSDPTSDNVISLAVLGERLSHVVTTVEEIKFRLDGLATRKEIADLVSRAEHSAAVVSLENRLVGLERIVQSNSPGHLIDALTKIALSVSAVGGAGALVYSAFRGLGS